MLIRYLDSPEAQDPTRRMAALETLLDLCLHSFAVSCVVNYTGPYLEAAKAAPPASNPALRAERARRVAYYLDAGRLAFDRPDVTARILDGDAWRHENALDGELYLRRQVLAANVRLAQGDAVQADLAVDKVLSLIAALKNPEAARFTVAWALADSIATLQEVHETERAYGLLLAAGGAIDETLPRLSVDSAVFRYTAALTLQEAGRPDVAEQVLDDELAALPQIELEPETQAWLQGRALTLKGAVCAVQGKLDCARAALAQHPYRSLYAQAGRVPANYDELTYLAARALTAGLSSSPDPVAAQALATPATFADKDLQLQADVYRSAGLALATPPGPERQAALRDLGRRLKVMAEARAGGPPGAWYRPGAIDQLLIALALTQAGADPQTDFALLQLAGRRGPAFDTDALTVLSQARDPLQRRAAHQALRLRARRDRSERELVQRSLARLAAAPASAAALGHDYGARRSFGEMAARMAQAQASLAEDGVALAGANLVALAPFQAALAPNEAALAVTPTAGGLAYQCVRRDGVRGFAAAADLARLRLDTRLLQQALTATYAPDAAADSQFPAAAAVRVYDVLIRPFAGCLEPGDRIVWLPTLAATGVPLAALLPALPPRSEAGYDLSQADWLVRRHAVSYTGSAAVLVAARAAGGGSRGDFDFLGVGDPVLTGQTADGADRRGVLLRGVRGGSRFAALAPLPETRDELEASARGFRSARLITEAAATEGGVRRELLGSYRFISFATHGLLRDDLQGLAEPALVLTPASASDAADDGLLTASEIADLNLSADFVALSACNTANFDLNQLAEELPALASAFEVAGAPATLATLWPVNSLTGKAVVAETFAQLRTQPGLGPADALAAAQRAFLAAPPGTPYLHPRFWAPFVVLGDGGPIPAPPPRRLEVRSVEVLTQRGGEVLSLQRTPAGVAARYMGDADAGGRHSAGVRLRRNGAEAWRQETREIGAARLIGPLGHRLAAFGYQLGAHGRYAPTLETFDPATGARRTIWTGEGLSPTDLMPLASVVTGPDRAVLLAGEIPLRDPPDPGGAWGLYVLEAQGGATPRLLFRIEVAAGAKLSDATVTVLGDDLLISYGDRAQPRTPGPPGLDDFEIPGCVAEPVTWLELRDRRTGQLKASRELRGRAVTAVLPRNKTALLAGSSTATCGAEPRAELIEVDARLQPRTLYLDGAPGASEARGLAALPDGRLFLAASKETIVDVRRATDFRVGIDPFHRRDLQRTYSGMALLLDAQGRPQGTRLLDSGSDVFVGGVEASDPADIQLGGSLGGEAAIFHLSAAAGGGRR